MKNKKFLDSMNNISDSVFDKYYKYESRLYQAQASRKRKFMKTCALAACLTVCVCICLALILPALIREDHTHPETYTPEAEETKIENYQPSDTGEASETAATENETQEKATFETERESEQTTEIIQPATFEYIFITPEFQVDESIPLQPEITDISADSVTIIWHNNGDSGRRFSHNYSIQRYYYGEWETLSEYSLLDDKTLLSLPPYETCELEYSLSNIEFNSEGIYRIRLWSLTAEYYITFTIGVKNSDTAGNIIIDNSITNENMYVSSGDTQISPLIGMCFKQTDNLNADGGGVEYYLWQLQDNSISDFEVPTIELGESLDIIFGTYSEIRTIEYINPSVNWTRIYNLSLCDIINLPSGEYYIIIELGTKYNETNFEVNEYLFKLIVL